MISEEGMRTAGNSFIQRRQPLQILLADILIKQQRERRRLAEDVNDTLMQLLAVSLMKIKHAQLVREEPRDILPDLERLLTQSLQHSRRLIRELSPTALLPAQLPMVFRRLADQMRDHGLIVTVEYAEKDLPVCPNLSMVIYQVMSELLFNVLTHARTASAVVTIEKRHDCDLTVTVRDHGDGFDTASLGESAIERHKFGLFSIQEQLTALGGRLSVESTIGAGTSATVVIPQTAYTT
jgi:signal transduction histidine kinase